MTVPGRRAGGQPGKRASYSRSVCGGCGTPLSPGAATARRCRDCIAADAAEPEQPEVYRGVKPSDHGERVRQGMLLYWKLKKADLVVEVISDDDSNR